MGTGNTLLPVVNTTLPALSEKFRVQLNVAGFNPDTIRTRVEGRKVIVEAKQEDRHGDGDFSVREIRKTYELPEHAGKATRDLGRRKSNKEITYSFLDRFDQHGILRHSKQHARD